MDLSDYNAKDIYFGSIGVINSGIQGCVNPIHPVLVEDYPYGLYIIHPQKLLDYY
jgi:hypothetical protein